jgi:hypothetical protein
MRVGDYVRTKSGIIGKIESKNYIGYSDWLIDTLYYNDDGIIDDWTCGVKEYDVLKSSPNIIDLIERFDFVNGHLVICKMYENEKDIPTIVKCVGDYYFKEEDIKSIVTKEAFSSVEYRVENN